ncbi:MAG: S-adenosylmethionine:tRNA ribosyltransferase-isomerase [bacterium ADurb.Bin478]|nr:MAG: S-adenosylmethionine:tRNA ribosyltransferase-isomerase [bacterium ADurb.Bin478]
MIDRIEKKGVTVVRIVLHLGLGSFRPVVVEDLSRHKMDSEFFDISDQAANQINAAKRNKKKVIAVGTSVVRALETSVTSEGWAKSGRGWTDKFIYPPYDFKIVDHMITNFHLPCSTLLMLVSAFASRDLILKAYRKAIRDKYMFYSYGDAMMIL